MLKINFSKDSTDMTLLKRSFVYDFLSSVRQKLNDPLNKSGGGAPKTTKQNQPAITASNSKATIFVIFIIGLTAGPAVSL